jgi:replicative DNA helicase
MSERLTVKEVSSELVRAARERAKDPRKVWGIPWGFPGLDSMTGGIQREEMTVLMARPGVGKSAFMGQTALQVAEWLQTAEGQRRHPDQVVKLVVCEMSAFSFQQRIVCYKARVSMRRAREGNLTPEQMDRYEEAAEAIAGLPIEYLDSPTSLEDTVRWLSTGKKTAWFALDYIGIHPVDPRMESASQWQKVTALSKGFREVCKSVAPGLILAQMNRECEKRDDTRPRMSDLRDSGSLEQDAWNILGLWREDVFALVSEEDRDRAKPASLIVLKQRNGPLGVVELQWVPRAGAFLDVSNLAEEDSGDVG